MLSGLFGLIAFIAFVWLFCRLAVTLPVIAVEGERSPVAALRRSWRMTKGHALLIFVAYLLFAIVIGGILLVLFLVMGGSAAAMIGMGSGDPSPTSLGVGIVVFFLVAMLVVALLAMIASSFMAALHADLADDRELAETFS